MMRLEEFNGSLDTLLEQPATRAPAQRTQQRKEVLVTEINRRIWLLKHDHDVLMELRRVIDKHIIAIERAAL